MVVAKREGVQVKFLVGDARKIDKVVGNECFDVILYYWSSVLGYYDEDVDYEILVRCGKIVKDRGRLMILQHINRDYLALAFSIRRVLEDSQDLGDYIIVETSRFDLLPSRFISTWSLYKKERNILTLIDRLETLQRVYPLHELVKIANKTGWMFEKVYASLRTLEEFTKPTHHMTYNLVFKPS